MLPLPNPQTHNWADVQSKDYFDKGICGLFQSKTFSHRPQTSRNSWPELHRLDMPPLHGSLIRSYVLQRKLLQ